MKSNIPQEAGLYWALVTKDVVGVGTNYYNCIVEISGTAPMLVIEAAYRIKCNGLLGGPAIFQDLKPYHVEKWGPRIFIDTVREAE